MKRLAAGGGRLAAGGLIHVGQASVLAQSGGRPAARYTRGGIVMSRREVMTGGLLAGTFEQTRSDRQDPASDERVAKALGEIRDELRRVHNACDGPGCPAVDTIRSQQRIYFKGQGKFPDYIDVGIEIWERLNDWHVTNRLPVQVVRMSDGRYGMVFQLTTLVLRHDMTNNYVGLGYDR
jgi:hypothetical protein